MGRRSSQERERPCNRPRTGFPHGVLSPHPLQEPHRIGHISVDLLSSFDDSSFYRRGPPPQSMFRLFDASLGPFEIHDRFCGAVQSCDRPWLILHPVFLLSFFLSLPPDSLRLRTLLCSLLETGENRVCDKCQDNNQRC